MGGGWAAEGPELQISRAKPIGALGSAPPWAKSMASKVLPVHFHMITRDFQHL